MASEGLIEKVIFDQRLIKVTQVYQAFQEERTTGTKAIRKETACLACFRSSMEMNMVGRK